MIGTQWTSLFLDKEKRVEGMTPAYSNPPLDCPYISHTTIEPTQIQDFVEDLGDVTALPMTDGKPLSGVA